MHYPIYLYLLFIYVQLTIMHVCKDIIDMIQTYLFIIWGTYKYVQYMFCGC